MPYFIIGFQTEKIQKITIKNFSNNNLDLPSYQCCLKDLQKD